MAEAVYDGFPGVEKNPCEELYGVDLSFMVTEDPNRVMNFISAKPDERKIRNIHIRSDMEFCYSAYEYLDELLWLFESPRTPYIILLADPSRLQKLVLHLRALSFEGTWLDDVEKLLDIKLENTTEYYLKDLQRFEKTLKEHSERTGDEIELLISQKRDEHNKLSHDDQVLRTIKVKKNVSITEDRNRLYEEYGVDLKLMTKENADRVVDFIHENPNERKFRNPYVPRDLFMRNLGYYYLNQLLCLLDDETPYTVLLYERTRLQGLVIRLRASSFEGSWLDELDDVDKFLETRKNVENSKQEPITQEEVLGIRIQWLTDQKKITDDTLVRVKQNINEVSQIRNLLHQTSG
ncbi:hypothetical protein TSUD_40280 [Trifolium subterraneum]|uniref:Uncharacterized protein n=1 Tax=Trifolium subterraneum TaxID=3900 RepID=A0A2Z6MJJ3_TRISU|nr:hypothetical protein TSUD_40280 [Trifolium subterraneum]